MEYKMNRGSDGLDRRILAQHPWGRECLNVCTKNGWFPKGSDIIRLIGLRSEIEDKKRDEIGEVSPSLQFARWLKEQGKIGEGEGSKVNRLLRKSRRWKRLRERSIRERYDSQVPTF